MKVYEKVHFAATTATRAASIAPLLPCRATGAKKSNRRSRQPPMRYYDISPKSDGEIQMQERIFANGLPAAARRPRRPPALRLAGDGVSPVRAEHCTPSLRAEEAPGKTRDTGLWFRGCCIIYHLIRP